MDEIESLHNEAEVPMENNKIENESQETKSKVVSIDFASRKKIVKEETPSTNPTQETSQPSVLDAMRKNAENIERIKKERLKANQSVLKSYKIKE